MFRALHEARLLDEKPHSKQKNSKALRLFFFISFSLAEFCLSAPLGSHWVLFRSRRQQSEPETFGCFGNEAQNTEANLAAKMVT